MRIWFIGISMMFIATLLSAQRPGFSFGLRTAVNQSQIEGDNLSGFKKSNFEIGLLGGFEFSKADEFQLSLNYETAGSKRHGENVPIIPGNYLVQLELNQISVHFAYARSFSEDWDGNFKYRAYTGFKMNRIMNSETQVMGTNLNNRFEIRDEDFKRNYWSFRSGIAIIIARRMLLGFFYDHALESILQPSEEIPLNRLIPYNFGLDFSYYLH